MNRVHPRKRRIHRQYYILLIFVCLDILLFSVWVTWHKGKPVHSSASDVLAEEYPETVFLQKSGKGTDIQLFFHNLALRKGAKYAYEVLRRAQLPDGTDIHLVGHAVGDILYKQEGVNGISVCTHEFRNACSHSIVVGLFTDKGEAALTDIAAACRKAPGGKGAYTMCFHGLGHGILSVEGYDMPKTVSICQKTATEQYGSQEASQCVGGAIMELLSGGAHDQDLWQRERVKYLSNQQPLLPCSAVYMPKESKVLCYTYLTPHLFEAVGTSLGSQSDEDIKKAFEICSSMPDSEGEFKNICWQGFGKEFVVLAHQRDIRSVDQMSDNETTKVYHWCSLSGNDEATQACLSNALESIYWGGENDRKGAIAFCNASTNSELKTNCFTQLINDVKYYIDDPHYHSQFCTEIPSAYKEQCINELHTS
jgi:hypothetical protein